MNQSAAKLKPKERKFLENVVQGMNNTDAYLAAGYKCRTRESAGTLGSRKLKELMARMGYEEVGEEYLPKHELWAHIKRLCNSGNIRVDVQAVNIATKVKGWQRDNLDMLAGAEIVILHRRPDLLVTGEEADDQPKQIQTKPVALLR